MDRSGPRITAAGRAAEGRTACFPGAVRPVAAQDAGSPPVVWPRRTGPGLDQLALERILAQALDRRYQAGLMPVGSRIKQEATAAWKSAIWRRSIAATERAWRSCWPLTSAAWT